MNRAYRVIFNHATGVWQCVSELARSKGKTKSFKALSVAIMMTMGSEAMAADIELSDGQVHHYDTSVSLIGDILITNAGTKLTSGNQVIFGSNPNNPANTTDTTIEISNGASTVSTIETIISNNSNTLVTVNNATLDSGKSLIVGFNPNYTAKLIGENGAKINANGIVNIGYADGGTASVELSGDGTTLTVQTDNNNIINIALENNAIGTLSVKDKAKVDAGQIAVGRSTGSTGTLNTDNATINSNSLIVGVEGNGIANLASSTFNLNDAYSLADGTGSIAKVDSKNNSFNIEGIMVVGASNAATLNSTNDTYKITKNLTVGQESGSKGVANFTDSIIRAKDFVLAVRNGSNGEATINGTKARLQIENELHIGSGGTGTLTLNQNSEYNVGHTYVGNGIYIGGGGASGTAGTQGGTGTLTLNDSTLRTNEIMVGNTGSGTLRLNSLDPNTYLTGLYTNQISRNANSKLSEIYINGAEIGITADQPNLFANFTKDNKIELGSKGVIFQTDNYQAKTGTDVIINPNAVITGNVGTIDLNNLDKTSGFMKTGKGTLTISEDSKQFTGDLAVAEGTLKIDGNYVMNGENLVIGLIDSNEDGSFDNQSEYGKFVVTGKADISNGNLKVYVDENINQGLVSGTAVNEVVSAGTLVGQFKQISDNHALVDFTADYSEANKVHLTMVKQGSTPTPTP
ncbi:hypothetical protein B0189_07820, partial [Moraxella cuniculi]